MAQLTQKRAVDAQAWRRPTGWSSVVVGVVALAGGGWVLAGYATDQRSLDGKVAQRDVGGRVVGIDAATYGTEQDRLDRSAALGGALVGVGVLAASVGGWLILSTPAASQVTLAPIPSGRGAVLSVRF